MPACKPVTAKHSSALNYGVFQVNVSCHDNKQACSRLSPDSLDFLSLTDEDEIDVVSVTGDKTEEKTTSLNSDTTREAAGRTVNTPPKKLRSRKSNSESSEQENEDGNARISHNDLERKRRNDLRNRFQCLRKTIPSLEESERAAKITILRRASELIPSLQKEEERLLALKDDEKKRNAVLLSTLMKLTKNNKRR